MTTEDTKTTEESTVQAESDSVQRLVSFEKWWNDEGSALRRDFDEDDEEYALRITRTAWEIGEYKAHEKIEKLQGVIEKGYEAVIENVYDNRTEPAARKTKEFTKLRNIYS